MGRHGDTGGEGRMRRVGATASILIGVLVAGWLVWTGWSGEPSAAAPKGERVRREMETVTGATRTAKPPIDEAVPARLETATFALG
jgi:hypothetical protein